MKRFLVGCGLLRRDPGGLRFIVPFLRSLLPGRTPLADVVPMMPFRAIEWLRAYVRPDMNVFEYGSGGSTVFFASRVRSLVSVEHDPEWYARTQNRLQALGLTCTYLLQPPEPEAKPRFSSTDERYRSMNFEAYVKTIDAYPDASFDLVSVDGRARVSAVLEAVPKVKPNGFLLLDDTYREEYSQATEALARYPRRDFPGLVPYNTDLGLTSVWQIAS